MFLNDILRAIGVELAHVYKIIKHDKNQIHMLVALQQSGNINKKLLKDVPIVANRNFSINYDDWEIIILKDYSIIHTIVIGVTVNGVFKQNVRIDIKKTSTDGTTPITIETKEDAWRIII
jgi:hypothetical protein